jgi:para-nitrobenzyl esterase
MQTIAISDGLIAEVSPDSLGVRCFKGVPYAAAPVGPLRWRPPAPVDPWTGVREALKFGPSAPQGAVFDDIVLGSNDISEDCLYLNIWTATSAVARGERLPVMFWIHGGGFVVGSGAEPRYDGTKLAARGIVVVTANYRLNALGYLAHRDLSAESPQGASGNYGLLDLVAALAWIKRNIQAFGGDPARVTIAGESAGSSAVSALMASPLAKGLFHAAIGESGALFDAPGRLIQSRAEAEEGGATFARKLGATSLAALRALPAKAILDAAPGLGFRPIVDGLMLPRPLEAVFAAGEQSDVPLLAGWNKDEGFNFSVLDGAEAAGAASYEAKVDAIFAEQTSRALDFYPAGDRRRVAASARALGGDMTIIHKTWAWIEAQRESGRAAIYRFRFDRCPVTPQGWFGAKPSAEAGAFHAGEIPYVFDTLDVMPGWTIAPDDRDIAKWVARYWSNFVKHGDPNGADAPTWPSYREAARPYLSVDAPPAVRNEQELEKHRFLSRSLKTKGS